MQFAQSEGIEITWTKTCTLLLGTFLFAPTLFAQTGGTLHISNNISYTGATTYIYTGQINTNINSGSVAIGSGWHDIETHFGSSGSTYSDSGQIMVRDNGSYGSGNLISLFPNTIYNPGWHDVELRFGTGSAAQSTDSGSMNLFTTLNPIVTTSSDSGSVPEPASLLFLALPVILRRRRLRAQIC